MLDLVNSPAALRIIFGLLSTEDGGDLSRSWQRLKVPMRGVARQNVTEALRCFGLFDDFCFEHWQVECEQIDPLLYTGS